MASKPLTSPAMRTGSPEASKDLNRPDAALSLPQRIPKSVRVEADGADDADSGQDGATRRGDHGAFGSLRPATALASPSTCFSSPLKTKFWSPNICWERDLIEVGEEDLRLSDQLAARQDSPLNGRPLGAKVQQLHVVHQLLARQDVAAEPGPGNLGQDDLLAKVVRLADQDAAGLRQPFEDERRRHHRVARKVLGKIVFGQAQVLDGPSRLPAGELQETVDPDPAHDPGCFNSRRSVAAGLA